VALKQACIADKLRISRRYVRSVDIVRDLEDPEALDGYVITPSSKDALRRIFHGLRKSSTQRAFRVTGPYGSGKSAFGLLLARTFIERSTKKGIATRLVSETGADLCPQDLSSYVPIVINGRRASFGDALLEAIQAAASGKGGSRSVLASRTASALKRTRERGKREDRSVLELLSMYAKDICRSRGKSAGILLIVDEIGRFIEFAAVNRATEDPAVFQQLAEIAGGAATAPVAVVAILHHRFSDYVVGFGSWAEAEWTRSAERFEDISFHESAEQTVFLLAQALDHPRAEMSLVSKRAKEIFDEACSRGLFGSSRTELDRVAASLYPLHPAVVCCLANFSRRFGQNERSVFGFLQSLEAYGFQRFILEKSYSPETWFRVPNLFDYIAAQGSIRPQSPDRERRWELLLDGLGQLAGASQSELQVFKSVGLLTVFEPIPGLKSDVTTIAWCTGNALDDVRRALEKLADRGLLYKRPHRDDFSLWASTSVDLDDWLNKAQVQVAPLARIGDLLQSISNPRPLVAHRHYHETGSLRAFDARPWGGTGLPPAPRRAECDGSIFIVPVYPDEKTDEVTARVRKATVHAGALELFCLRQVTPGDLAIARDAQMWRWIEDNCKELRADDFARREVQKRRLRAEMDLKSAFAPFASSRSASDGIWIHQGRHIKITDQRSLNQKLSDLCDQVFEKAPILKNELINRSKLSSAAASARMRLLELMCEDSGKEYLGLEGAPPERTIYLSVFHHSGLHRKAGDRWVFSAPGKSDPQNWSHVWSEIGRYLQERSIVPFNVLMEHLAAPPWGLRTGPALLVIAAFMINRRNEIALMERNSFQPDITGAHFQRLVKNPVHFAIRYLSKAESKLGLLEAIAAKTVIWKGSPAPEPTVKGITEAIYQWWNGLSSYAQETARVTNPAQAVRAALKKANEPIKFIYEDLPEACGSKGISTGKKSDVNEFIDTLNSAFQEIMDAQPRLRLLVESAALDSFGTASLAALREQIRSDYLPHSMHLTDYRLRAFIERAATADMPDDKWLDSIAGLLSGRRLDNWQDSTLDQFQFEIRVAARRMARWLSMVRTSIASSVPLVGIHIVDMSGQEQMVVVRRDTRSPAHVKKIEQIRQLLRGTNDAADVLGQLMIEYVPVSKAVEKIDG
jgi:hypothetical protein